MQERSKPWLFLQQMARIFLRFTVWPPLYNWSIVYHLELHVLLTILLIACILSNTNKLQNAKNPKKPVPWKLQNQHCLQLRKGSTMMSNSGPTGKKQAQGVQLAVENCSFLGRANALSASILQGHHCSNFMHRIQFTMKKHEHYLWFFVCVIVVLQTVYHPNIRCRMTFECLTKNISRAFISHKNWTSQMSFSITLYTQSAKAKSPLKPQKETNFTFNRSASHTFTLMTSNMLCKKTTQK
jgi:hypothetical protein